MINPQRLLRFASYAKWKDVHTETVRQWKLRQTIKVVIIDEVQFVELNEQEFNEYKEFYNLKK